jgi:transposase-like protein
MGEYTASFKETMVKKMVGPEARSATALAREVGVSQGTLSRWMREYGRLGGKREGSVAKRAQDWGAEEKLLAVVEYLKLEEDARGTYLRQKGLYSADIERWRAEMLAAVGKRPKKAADAQGQRIRELEAELRRKEKALAETAALLVLKKSNCSGPWRQ